MERINTSITLLIVVIFATSMLIIAGFSIAQSTPKPTTPQFSIQVVDNSYDVPTTTTTSTDYNGRILTSTTLGYNMKNGSITIPLKISPSRLTTIQKDTLSTFTTVSDPGVWRIVVS